MTLNPERDEVVARPTARAKSDIHRAAAALIPIIEAGLINSTLSIERSALMASFCEWSMANVSDDPEVIKLAENVGRCLKRIKAMLVAGALTQ